jgi:hypothetical protein
MSKFNLSDYETVKNRKLRFYADHPDGRICVHLVNDDLDEKAVVKASVYFNGSDQEKMLPRGSGYALEIRDKSLSKNQYGKEYESVNYSSWLENCEESAVGRALDNAGYASNSKCSKDEIEKAERNSSAIKAAFPNAKAGYVATFGKYKGQALSSVNREELDGYVMYLEKKAKEDGKPIQGVVAEFISEAKKITGMGNFNL